MEKEEAAAVAMEERVCSGLLRFVFSISGNREGHWRVSISTMVNNRNCFNLLSYGSSSLKRPKP
ncbi:hypothetical protein Lal_00032171 [Lupinus albus]|nr:hypothetical protein Lal_00032171 [Lupinus albus]